MPDPGRQPRSSKWKLCSWSLKITFPFLYNIPDPGRQLRSSKWEQCSRLVEFVSQFLFNMPDTGRQPGSSRWDLLSRSLVIVFPILKVISRIHSNTNHFLASGNRSWFPYNYTDQGRQTRSQKNIWELFSQFLVIAPDFRIIISDLGGQPGSRKNEPLLWLLEIPSEFHTIIPDSPRQPGSRKCELFSGS